MSVLQGWIHALEQGGGLRYFKRALIPLGLLFLVVGYNYRGFRDMANPEAMDAAQLARNLAEGRGYTTLFIRPLSLYLVQKAHDEKYGPASVGDMSDRSQLRTVHPDLANPPVYPVLLAGLMKILPSCRYQPAGADPIWNKGTGFWIYPPDFCISLFNQGLFFASILLVFFLARRLFGSGAAWTSAALLLGTDLFWRFSTSGLSTMLVILIFLALVWCLVLLEQNAREENWLPTARYGMAALIGALVALGALTRYSFGWLILPVLAFLLLFLGRHRLGTALIALTVFLGLLTPWIVRNYQLSHTLFGTAGYALYETTASFPDFRLERSLNPDLGLVNSKQIALKLVANLQTVLENDLPKAGGNWITAFFLAGLLVGFRDPTISRLRWFILFCLPVLVIAQALGRTGLSEQVPVVNSENLLVIMAPLLILFGVSLFLTLLDEMELQARELRYLVVWGFGLVACLPLLLTCAHRTPAPVYPPYHPPLIQEFAGWLNSDELMMSDIPWAVAWYGERQCLWLTLNSQDDFYKINDFQKPIQAAYFTEETMDSRFLSQFTSQRFHAGEYNTWGSFILNTVAAKQPPRDFPLRKSPPIRLWPAQFFLTDRERWLSPGEQRTAQGH